jgi:hypothetical protein
MCTALLPPGVYQMCTALLPPGVYPTAVKNKYITHNIYENKGGVFSDASNMGDPGFDSSQEVGYSNRPQ